MIKQTINDVISAVRDTLSSRYHSKDFIFARSEYLRARLATICLIFVLLTPFWTVFDWFLLPEKALYWVLPARLVMFIGLLLTLWASKKTHSSAKINLFLSGITLALPALFYAVVLLSLSFIIPHSLIGYSFIPFLLVGMLSIFPFTLVESFILGLGLLLLQFFSGFITATPFSADNLQNLWLLFALLSVVMTSNHFHLSLLLRLYRQATHDPLTGLLNRIALERHTEQIAQQQPRPQTAVILLDLDFFKKINDNYGHSVGDQVLRQFAELLKKESTDNELICRYGGEEFLVLVTHKNKQDVIAKAELVRQQTEQLVLHTLEQEPFHISVSQGISMLRKNESMKKAIQRADERLYMAKRKGRNCVVAEDIIEDTSLPY